MSANAEACAVCAVCAEPFPPQAASAGAGSGLVVTGRLHSHDLQLGLMLLYNRPVQQVFHRTVKQRA